jgi:CheY-like chemotaxis protein
MEPDSDPLLFVTISNQARKNQLCRALTRIWESPVFFIKATIRETVSHVIEKSLLGETPCPDIILIDLESGEKNANAIIDTIRSISGLRHSPLIALLDGENIELMNQTYDAGADLVVFWDKLESRTGDIAALAIDNWLSTENEYPDDMRARSGS